MGNEGPFLPSSSRCHNAARRKLPFHFRTLGRKYQSESRPPLLIPAGVAGTAVKSRGVGRARYRAQQYDYSVAKGGGQPGLVLIKDESFSG